MKQRKGKVYNFRDLKNKKSDKRQEQARKDMPNAQNSVARQTAKQRALHSAEDPAKQGNTRCQSWSDRDRSKVKRAVMPDSGEAMQDEHDPTVKRRSYKGVASSEQACMRLELQVEKVYAYWWTMGLCWLQCVIVLVAMHCVVPLGCCLNPLHVKSHIANAKTISWSMTCCVLLVMSPASNQIAEIRTNTPAPVINIDMQLGARAKINPVIKTKDTSNSKNSTEHTDNGSSEEIKLNAKKQTSGSNIDLIELDRINLKEMGELEEGMAHGEVSGHGAKAMKCMQCGKSRKVSLAESKAMAAAATNTAGKTPLTVEKVQHSLVKALVTRGPATAAFADMNEFERGNRFGLEEQTILRAIAEGETADEASSGDVGTGEDDDTRPHRGPDWAAQILTCFESIIVAVGVLSKCVTIVAQWGARIGEMGNELVTILRMGAGLELNGAMAI